MNKKDFLEKLDSLSTFITFDQDKILLILTDIEFSEMIKYQEEFKDFYSDIQKDYLSFIDYVKIKYKGEGFLKVYPILYETIDEQLNVK